MSRLIDADFLIADLQENFCTEITCSECLNMFGRKICDVVYEQPTAYSVEKVVEQLENIADHYECEEQGREDVYMVDLEPAIDIVMGGGKE